jgi:hypothetical protein
MMRMIRQSITGLALILLFFTNHAARCQDYAAWIRSTDSRDNTLIAEMIEQGDLAVAHAVARSLAAREDSRIEEIIIAIEQKRAGSSRGCWEREHILRVLLAGVFSQELKDSVLEERLLANRNALDYLLTHLTEYDLPLKREIIRLLSALHPPEYQQVLMAEGRKITELLAQQEGRLEAEQAALIVTFLDTVKKTENPEFADLALSILRLGRHPEVAERARSTARSLLLGL